jgi:predicted Rdx family selenoprotein
LKAGGFDADAIKGAKSQYDVIADGQLVFSKQQQGRFPEPSEILSALAPG